MSSPKATAKAARRPASAKPKLVASKPKVAANGLSADAIKLAKEIEVAFKKSDDAISEQAMQTLMTALCRVIGKAI